MLASSQGHLITCQQLIERGADTDAIDEFGRTALIIAAMSGFLDVCELLVSLGADEGHKVWFISQIKVTSRKNPDNS